MFYRLMLSSTLMSVAGLAAVADEAEIAAENAIFDDSPMVFDDPARETGQLVELVSRGYSIFAVTEAAAPTSSNYHLRKGTDFRVCRVVHGKPQNATCK